MDEEVLRRQRKRDAKRLQALEPGLKYTAALRRVMAENVDYDEVHRRMHRTGEHYFVARAAVAAKGTHA